jgi:glycosyltransferase involved in cell wall biosynthesis
MRNLLGRWKAAGASVHCWAIGFDGYGYEQVDCRLLPGGKRDWNSPARLGQLLKLIGDGNYTHLFILMDPDALSVGDFPQKLRQACKAKKVRVLLYYPVDAPPERDWLGILDAVDVAVAFTEYGRAETRKALGKSLYPIEVVPHGVDECFKPLPVEEREQARVIELVRGGTKGTKGTKGTEVVQFVEKDTFLMLNVNKNEWRKDPLRSLEILWVLRNMGMPAKLLFRMDAMSAMGGIHLELAAKQLGLTYGKEWCHIGPVGDEALVALYNAADLYLTTSMGEGWGLGVTEAMACHCPVAMAQHTSLAEIAAHGCENGVIWLPMEEGNVCGADTRLRRRVNLPAAAAQIYRFHYQYKAGTRCAPAAGALKSWDWVAERLLELMEGVCAN